MQFHELVQPDIVFLLAESAGTPVGYVQLIMNSRDQAIPGNRPLEIRRIYALQEHLGKGVGKELMDATIREARYRACDCIWLGGGEKNQRAIDFYKKWGFRQVGVQTFSLGTELQNDLIMVLKLT
ncbi:MAG TPA: GNAT family N-acetyltransferase [Anaerolineales bacterium]|nr:GNAT family N-acetyltransferase [Anaerolineales bacterium]